MISTTGNEIDIHGVNHPAHYNTDPSGVECIEITRHMSFNLGSAFKYIFRAGRKDLVGNALESELKDLRKAIWYFDDEIAANSFWTDRKRLYREPFLRIIESRKGYIRLAFESIYNNNLENARTFVLAEIKRLEAYKIEA